MKTYKMTFITSAGREYTSERFQTDVDTPEEAFAKFAAKYGVEGSGVAFPASFPKNRFVFITTPAMTSIEVVEIDGA